MPPTMPTAAMVLAAGLGTRMRPLTDTRPKPLVPVAGKALLDHGLDRLAAAGVDTAVVNVHYLAEQIIAHVAGRQAPRIVISDERDRLLETGGGVVRALPLLGPAPFFLLNADSFWVETGAPALAALAAAWDPAAMDALLLLARPAGATGYDGPGDFAMDAAGRLRRRGAAPRAPYVYTGAGILAPALFAGAPEGAFSLNLLFDRAIAAGRLHGVVLDGTWCHVGTPGAIAAAEAALAAAAA